MPLYSYSLTVPPNTAENIPVRNDVMLGFNILSSVGVLFPAGCLNAVGVCILLDGIQIAPLPAGWIRGDNIYFEWAENRPSRDAATISILGYSLADDYEHTPVIYLKVG